MEQILRERVKQVSSSDRTCNLADKVCSGNIMRIMMPSLIGM